MYYIEQETGKINKVDSTDTKIYSCIFDYLQNEDSNLIEGKIPLYLKSAQELADYLKSPAGEQDILERLTSNKVVVIRNLDIIEL